MQNKVTWAIQSNLISYNQQQQVLDAAIACGCEVQEIVVIPFSTDFGNDVPEIEGIVIPYGSAKLTKLGLLHGWKGTFFDEETSKVNVWLENRDDMLNSNSIIMKVKDTEEYFKDTNENELRFIRPVKDLKEFNGTVTTVKEVKNWMKSVDSGNFSFDEETDIAIAPVQNINMEYRFFVVGRKVIDGCSYRTCGQLFSQPITNPKIWEAAQELADGWLPHPVVCMDVAVLDNGDMKVIEFNTACGSGFYAYHNIPKIITAISEYAKNLGEYYV